MGSSLGVGNMDVKFSSAIHVLILVSEAEYPMSSEQIAESVGTNVRKIRKSREDFWQNPPCFL